MLYECNQCFTQVIRLRYRVKSLLTCCRTNLSVFLVSAIGTFGCICFGQLISQCNITVPIESFPQECTSFLYNGAVIGADYTVSDPNSAFLDVEGNITLYSVFIS